MRRVRERNPPPPLARPTLTAVARRAHAPHARARTDPHDSTFWECEQGGGMVINRATGTKTTFIINTLDEAVLLSTVLGKA